MTYKVKYEKKAVRQLSKLDHSVRAIIKAWIEKNLVNTDDPRKHGKGLKGNMGSYWRYRVGDYRIIAEIKDNELLIIVIEVGHRSSVYNR